MPIVFGFAGIILIISGVRATTPQLMALLKQDFTGTPNYTQWIIAILLVGFIGYIPKMAELSRAFMVLIVIGLFLSNKGFFAQFQQQTAGA